MIGPDPTARADLASAVDQERALDLQLRGPGGAVIATEDIAIIDTDYLLSLAESDLGDDAVVNAEEEEELEAFVEEWCADRDCVGVEPALDEQGEFPRYQIQILLADPDSLP